jgi:hypothetical protein
VLFLSAFAYPLLLCALALGVGLAIERAAATTLPGALTLPLGFAGIVGLTQIGTSWAAMAPLATPLVVVVAMAGLVLGRARLAPGRARVIATLPAVLTALALYLTFAAPVILSGRPTWTAYGVDTTSAFHWLGAEHVASKGLDFSDAGQSAATAITAGYFANSYPAGGNTALGVTARLTGVAVAWLWQPFLAVVCALLGLALYALVSEVVSPRWLAAGIAFVGAQPALLYGLFLQGQVKEVIAVMLLPLMAGVLLAYRRSLPDSWRAPIPLAVAGAAGVGATGVGFAAWLGTAALVALGLAARPLWPHHRRLLLLQVGCFAAVFAILALPALSGLRAYLDSVSNLLTNEPPLGSLLQPLSPLQTAGIWFSGDYRLRPTVALGMNFAMIGAVGVGALLAAEWALRRRAWPMIAYAAVAMPGCLVVAARGTPWVDVKAMVLAAPLVLTLGLLGTAVALVRTPLRIAGVLLALAISAAVLYSNAQLYHDTQLAPSKRYRELERVADRFQGPTLRPDFDDYALFFARHMRPDGPGDARWVQQPLLIGGMAPGYGRSFRLDDLQPNYVTRFPTLLLQRSPFESRAPAIYSKAWEGTYYEVWRRGPGTILAHLPAGSQWDATGRVPCEDVRRVAREARAQGARLAVAERPESVTVDVGALPRPAGWSQAADPEQLAAVGAGRVRADVSVPRDGRWSVWLAGSFSRPVTVSVDGRRIGALSDEIKYGGLAQRVGETSLAQGRHTIEILRSGGDLAPGNGAAGAIGPLALTPGPDIERPVVSLDPSDYRKACGREVDWIEAVKR